MKQLLLFLICLFVLSLDSSAQQIRNKNKAALREIIYDKSNDIKIRFTAYKRMIFKTIYYQKDSAAFYLNAYKREAIEANSQSNISVAYSYEIKLLLYEGKYEEAIIPAKKRLRISQSLNRVSQISSAYNDLGNCFQKGGALDSALYYYHLGLEKAESKVNKLLTVRSLINISETLKLKDQYIEALKIIQKALNINRNVKGRGYLATIHGVLGSIYMDVEDYEKARYNFEKAIKSAYKNNIKRKAMSYELLSDCLIKTKEFSLAEESLLESIRLGRKAKIPLIEGRALSKLAELYLTDHKATKALKTILKSEALLRDNMDRIELIYCLKTKGSIYNYLRNYSAAQEACLAAQELNLKPNQQTAQMKICYCLYKTYQGQKETSKALKYLEAHHALKDSLMNHTISRKITKLEYQNIYDAQILSDSFKTINALAKRDLEYTRKSAKQGRFLTISIALAAIFLLCIIFLIVLYVLNKRSREELKHKNDIIEGSLGEKEILLKEIHHRVKNNLQTISGLLDLQSRATEEPLIKDALSEGQARIKSMALIHQKLYQTENLALIDLHHYLKELIQYLKSLYHQDTEITFNLDIEDITLDIDTAIPLGLIINEMLSNSFKYAFEKTANPQIGIQIIPLEKKGTYQLTYTDNGKGLPDDFNIKKVKSLGIKLIRRLTQQLLGKYSTHNKNGLTFIIIFMDTASRNENS